MTPALGFCMVLLMLTSFFMVVLVLIQRGRGGGLAGAFGGMGGQSAFGTKAGDLFTKITIGAALFWIFLCIASIKLANNTNSLLSPELGRGSGQTTPSQTPATGTPATGTPATDATGAEAPAAETPAAPAAETPASGAAPGDAPAAGTPAESAPPAETPATP